MTDSSKKINSCAVIPCYNEKNTIRQVVQKLNGLVDLIIIVDDGSSDGSTDFAKNEIGIALLKNGQNIGKGAALNRGLIHAASLNADFVVTLDADLQHPPELLPLFIDQLRDYDAVIGVRKRAGTPMPPHRRLSNFLTTFLLYLKTGRKLRDSQCGYRAYRVSAIMDILPVSSGFEAETEILIKAARKGLSFGFVDLPTIYGKTDSKMKALQAISGFIRVILKKY